MAETTTVNSLDPLTALGDDIFTSILRLLDSKSLLKCSFVCRKWMKLSLEDCLWKTHLSALLEGKQWIHPDSLLPSARPLQSYKIALEDSKRTTITEEDLLRHAWHFHFKEDIGWDLVQHDPYWQGKAPMEMTFHADQVLIPEPHEIFFSSVRFQWKFVGDAVDGVMVQVNEFPPLTVIRRSDNWGWVLQNQWVRYDSSTKPPKPRRF